MKLLAAADIHIGRKPSHLPLDGVARLHIWEKIVNYAIDTEVDAVLLAGDIIDSSNKFFESIGILERGLQLLAQHGISSFAIAGNHDFDVLRRVWSSLKLPHFHLIGQHREWEMHKFISKSGEILQIVGYSFYDSTMPASPLSPHLKALYDPSLPAVGLLHGDLDVYESRYCPFLMSELTATGIPTWILGHIHKPQLFNTACGAQVLYTGSPQGLDPGECGMHGPWIVDYQGFCPTLTQVPLAAVRYERVEVDITSVNDSGELQSRLMDALRAQADGVECLSLRVEVKGVSSLPLPVIHEALKPLLTEGTYHRETRIFVNKAEVNVRPEIDLQQLAQEEHIQGQIAKLILDLDKSEYQQLMEKLAMDIKELRQTPPFQHHLLADIDVKQMVVRQAHQLLEFVSL